METITSKAVVREFVQSVIATYNLSGVDPFIAELHGLILTKKIKFPLLEFAATELYSLIPEKDQIKIMDRIINLDEIGGYVLGGIILQLRLGKHFQESMDKAEAYIIQGDKWYVCDIIGERVMGHALLTMPEDTIPVLKKSAIHSNKWLVRTVGVATHYAVKKGLEKEYVEQMFQLLLSLAHITEFHTKKGIGWAAKTIAKFYPDIISKYKVQIESNTQIRKWFMTKLKIGLGRSDKYASRYSD